MRQVASQQSVRYPDDEHRVRLVERHLIRAGVVEQREFAGLEAGLATVLSVDATALQLRMQEEHRLPRPCDMLDGVVHDGRRGAHLAQQHLAHRRARQAGLEALQIERIGDDRRESAGCEIVPELDPPPGRKARRGKRLESRHRWPPGPPVFSSPSDRLDRRSGRQSLGRLRKCNQAPNSPPRRKLCFAIRDVAAGGAPARQASPAVSKKIGFVPPYTFAGPNALSPPVNGGVLLKMLLICTNSCSPLSASTFSNEYVPFRPNRK